MNKISRVIMSLNATDKFKAQWEAEHPAELPDEM